MSADPKAEAWAALAQAARDFAADKNQAQMLSDAAKQWATASKPAPAPRTGDEPVIPFGRSKGTPLSAATPRDLEWVAGALRKSVDDPEKARWREQNAALLAQVEDELSKR